MATAVEKLPDDPALLKALIRKERESFQMQLNTLIEALHLERHRRYGTRSEKAPGQGELLEPGTRREIGPANGLMVCDHLKGLREYDFRSSGSEPVSVDGVTLLEVMEQGVVLEVMQGSDRRYLKVQVLGGAKDGKVVWLLARQFRELPEVKR